MIAPKVLVIDDDLAVCKILHRTLTEDNYQIDVATSVAAAAEFIDRTHHDLYLVDYNLPDGTGLDIAERIRAKGSRAPIILISGYQSSILTIRVQKLAIFEIIEKPFSQIAIRNVAHNALVAASEARYAANVQDQTATKKPQAASPAWQPAPEPAPKEQDDKDIRIKKPFPKTLFLSISTALIIATVAGLYIYIRFH
jgi:two-component system, NtrC family, nitrogen regulation response regulator GlnG